MKIYTKTGDKGTSSLWGGKRVSKGSLRIDTYGEVDELVSLIGYLIALQPSTIVRDGLAFVQPELMAIASALATPPDAPKNLPRVSLPEDAVLRMENEIDSADKELASLKSFILPGGSKVGSLIHYARTVARRVERAVVRLSLEEEVDPYISVYLNRLSDWLFTMARLQNKLDNVEETKWESGL